MSASSIQDAPPAIPTYGPWPCATAGADARPTRAAPASRAIRTFIENLLGTCWSRSGLGTPQPEGTIAAAPGRPETLTRGGNSKIRPGGRWATQINLHFQGPVTDPRSGPGDLPAQPTVAAGHH